MLLFPAILSACVVNTEPAQGETGRQGERGSEGEPGAQGKAGPAGLSCWDVDGNGLPDTPEDSNLDGEWNALDCTGPVGPPGDSQWLPSPTGIHYSTGSVSIGTADTKMLLEVAGPVKTGHEIRMTNAAAPAEHRTWRTYVDSNSWYLGTMDDDEVTEDIALSVVRSGPTVSSVAVSADLLVTGATSIDGSVTIGQASSTATLTVDGSVAITAAGDVYVSDNNRGVILRAPSGMCFRLRVADSGNLVTEQAGCPQ